MDYNVKFWEFTEQFTSMLIFFLSIRSYTDYMKGYVYNMVVYQVILPKQNDLVRGFFGKHEP